MASLAITDAEENQLYLIGRVKDQDPELLRYLEKNGILPGVKVTILDKAPFDGPIKIKLEDIETTIGNSVAKDVFLVEV